MATTIYFLFIGQQRAPRPLVASEGPTDPVWIVRSLPGNVVASGSTYDDAERKLMRLLESRFRIAKSPLTWWMSAKSRMKDADRNLFSSSFGEMPPMLQAPEFTYFRRVADHDLVPA